MKLGKNIVRISSLAAVMLAGLTALRVSAAYTCPDTSGIPVGLHSGYDTKIQQYEDFGAWIGRKVTYRVVFCDATKWSGIASPYMLSTSIKWIHSDPYRWEVISVPILINSQVGKWDDITSGQQDATFRSLATKLVKNGIVNRVIIRLGWEGNGGWYPWAVGGHPELYRAAFRHIVSVMRAVAPNLKFMWCIACRVEILGIDWRKAYPGDDDVDIMGIDVYDQYVKGWNDLEKGAAGLDEFRAFAVLHQKPEAYAEWSCSTNSNGGNGDDPAFIEHMAQWMVAAPTKVVFQAYWNTSAGGPNAAIFGPSSGNVPNAAAAYRQCFGGAPSNLSVTDATTVK